MGPFGTHCRSIERIHALDCEIDVNLPNDCSHPVLAARILFGSQGDVLPQSA